MAAVTITAPTYPRTPVSFQAGESFSVTLNGLGAVSGNVSLRWWRVGEPEATHTERAAWTIAGVTLTIAGTATRYLDGNYHWALWWEPTVGEQVCLIPASGMFVSTSGGFATADPDVMTEADLEQLRADVADGWSAWDVSDQSASIQDYIEVPLADLTNDYIFEMQLELKGATRRGWYTRYRIVSAGSTDTIGGDTASALYSRTGLQYTGSTYTVATVGANHFLRFVLGNVYEPLTTKVVRWRTRQI